MIFSAPRGNVELNHRDYSGSNGELARTNERRLRHLVKLRMLLVIVVLSVVMQNNCRIQRATSLSPNAPITRDEISDVSTHTHTQTQTTAARNNKVYGVHGHAGNVPKRKHAQFFNPTSYGPPPYYDYGRIWKQGRLGYPDSPPFNSGVNKTEVWSELGGLKGMTAIVKDVVEEMPVRTIRIRLNLQNCSSVGMKPVLESRLMKLALPKPSVIVSLLNSPRDPMDQTNVKMRKERENATESVLEKDSEKDIREAVNDDSNKDTEDRMMSVQECEDLLTHRLLEVVPEVKEALDLIQHRQKEQNDSPYPLTPAPLTPTPPAFPRNRSPSLSTAAMTPLPPNQQPQSVSPPPGGSRIQMLNQRHQEQQMMMNNMMMMPPHMQQQMYSKMPLNPYMPPHPNFLPPNYPMYPGYFPPPMPNANFHSPNGPNPNHANIPGSPGSNGQLNYPHQGYQHYYSPQMRMMPQNFLSGTGMPPNPGTESQSGIGLPSNTGPVIPSNSGPGMSSNPGLSDNGHGPNLPFPHIPGSQSGQHESQLPQQHWDTGNKIPPPRRRLADGHPSREEVDHQIDGRKWRRSDWFCPRCGFRNFASRKQCLRCKMRRDFRERNRRREVSRRRQHRSPSFAADRDQNDREMSDEEMNTKNPQEYNFLSEVADSHPNYAMTKDNGNANEERDNSKYQRFFARSNLL